MLSKQNMLRSTFCSIFFIVVTSAAPNDLRELIFKPISYHDAYPGNNFTNPVHAYEDSYHKTKRQTSNLLKQGDDLISETQVPLTPQRMKELIQMLKKPKKSGIFTLNGWSASGMPFNVLYSPNTLQQKFLATVNVMAGKKPLAPAPAPQPLRENLISERKEDKKEYLRAIGAKTSNRPPQMRRHYLVIPQLFVSYGWGSSGK